MSNKILPPGRMIFKGELYSEKPQLFAFRLIYLPDPYPGHYKFDNKLYLPIGQVAALFYCVPFFKTAPAAGRRGVLRLEDKMSFHESLCLFAVIQGIRDGQSICYKSPGVCVYARQAPVVCLCAFLTCFYSACLLGLKSI